MKSCGSEKAGKAALKPVESQERSWYDFPMENIFTAVKDWVSDPVVAAVLGFIVTSTILRFLSRRFGKSRKK